MRRLSRRCVAGLVDCGYVRGARLQLANTPVMRARGQVDSRDSERRLQTLVARWLVIGLRDGGGPALLVRESAELALASFDRHTSGGNSDLYACNQQNQQTFEREKKPVLNPSYRTDPRHPRA
jgi:hypothetical protein